MKITSLILLSLLAPAVMSSRIDYTRGMNNSYNTRSVEGGSANRAWSNNGGYVMDGRITPNQISRDTTVLNINQNQRQNTNSFDNTQIRQIQQARTQYTKAPEPIIEIKESNVKQNIKNVVEYVDYKAPAQQANNSITMINAPAQRRHTAPKVIVMPAAPQIKVPQQRIVLEAPKAATIVNKTIILRAAEQPVSQDKHIIVFNHGSNNLGGSDSFGSNSFGSNSFGSNEFGSSWGLNNAVAGEGGLGGTGGYSSGFGSAGEGGNGGQGGIVDSNGHAGHGGQGGAGGNATMYGQSGHGGQGGAGGYARNGGRAGNGGQGGMGGSVKGTVGGDKPTEAQIQAYAQQKANQKALVNRINSMVDNMSNNKNLNVGSSKHF